MKVLVLFREYSYMCLLKIIYRLSISPTKTKIICTKRTIEYMNLILGLINFSHESLPLFSTGTFSSVSSWKTLHKSIFSSFTLGLSVHSRQWARHTAWTHLAVPCSLCLMAASPSHPCPWLSLSVPHPGGHISARELQPGQGRQVCLS